MWSFIGKLFGSDNAASSLINNISNGVDKLYYSEEEKAEDKAQAVREGNQVYIKWLESTSGSNLARRFIAIVVTLVWAAQYVASMVCASIAPWVESVTTSKSLMETSAVLQANGEQGNAAFMVVLGFYFLGNHAKPMYEAAVNMFTKKKDK